MKRCFLELLKIFTLALFLGASFVQAQEVPLGPSPDGKPPGGREQGGEGRLRGGKGMPPELRGGELFLQAGDPRFERMIVLAFVPEDRVDAEMQKWPHYQEQDTEGRERMRRQLNFFRKRIQAAALKEAEATGLQVPPRQQEAFVRAYWEKRIEVEKRIRAEVEPRLKAAMVQVMTELKSEFAPPPPALGAAK